MKLVELYGFQQGCPKDACSCMWPARPICPSCALFLAAPSSGAPPVLAPSAAALDCSGSDSLFLAALFPVRSSRMGKALAVWMCYNVNTSALDLLLSPDQLTMLWMSAGLSPSRLQPTAACKSQALSYSCLRKRMKAEISRSVFIVLTFQF